MTDKLPKLLTHEEVAASAGVSVRTLYNEYRAGTGPVRTWRGKRRFVAEPDRDEWLSNRTRREDTPSAEETAPNTADAA